MLVSVNLPSGMYQNGTELQAQGRYTTGNLVRFYEKTVRPWGGWQLHSSASAMAGVPRAMIAWRQNTNGTRWIAVATTAKLYVIKEDGTLVDITPIRKTSSLTNVIATTSGSGTVTITDTAHGAVVGDSVIISGASAFNGLTTGQLNQTFVIATVPTANTFTVATGGSANATSSGGGTFSAKYEITPGNTDATNPSGYGAGPYGTGTYGTPRTDTSAVTPATVWTLDLWGDHLVAVSDHDGSLYEWALDTTAPAALITNAPTSCLSLVVTPEGMLMALGAGGDRRTIANSDQYADTTWAVLDTNQARTFPLRTAGTVMRGVAMKGQTLLLTTVDAWTARYQGYPLVYGYTRVGQGCGLIAKGAVAATDNQAVWMSASGFFAFDGSNVTPLECEVFDGVFGNLNTLQSSKVAAVHLSAFGEVVWFYPSLSSLENDSYVAFNYREGHWATGTLARTAGWDRGPFNFPLMVSPDGFVYEHETGWSYSGASPYLESGPFQLGKGDRRMEVQRVLPDERTLGQVTLTFKTRTYPDGSETNFGPYTMADPTDALFQADQVRLRYDGAVLADWRIGEFKLDLIPGDPLL